MAATGKNTEQDPIAPVAPTAPRQDLSLSRPITPAQRVTSVLLNGKNFHAWSRSFHLYLGGKRKIGWVLGKVSTLWKQILSMKSDTPITVLS